MEPAPKFPDPLTIDLKRTYDVVVVGSGAAGGMAANVLTAKGLDVLLLEAGHHVDTSETLKSSEWPYEHPRHGKLGPETYVLDEGDYYK